MLARFVEILFHSSAYQDSSLFCGFYLTSSTQDGSPSDKVLAELSQSFDLTLRSTSTARRRAQTGSYFAKGVLSQVV